MNFPWTASPVQTKEAVRAKLCDFDYYREKFGEDNPPPAKVLNYVIQAYETERNIQILKQIKEKYKGLGKLIMYNYDAFVFDVPNYEITYLYEEIYEKIIDSKQFPATIVTGENYDFK